MFLPWGAVAHAHSRLSLSQYLIQRTIESAVSSLLLLLAPAVWILVAITLKISQFLLLFILPDALPALALPCSQCKLHAPCLGPWLKHIA